MGIYKTKMAYFFVPFSIMLAFSSLYYKNFSLNFSIQLIYMAIPFAIVSLLFSIESKLKNLILISFSFLVGNFIYIAAKSDIFTFKVIDLFLWLIYTSYQLYFIVFTISYFLARKLINI